MKAVFLHQPISDKRRLKVASYILQNHVVLNPGIREPVLFFMNNGYNDSYPNQSDYKRHW